MASVMEQCAWERYAGNKDIVAFCPTALRISWFIYFYVCSCPYICRESKGIIHYIKHSTALIAPVDNTVKGVAVRGSVVAERDHWRVYSFPLPW